MIAVAQRFLTTTFRRSTFQRYMGVGDAIWTAALGQAQALPYLPEELEAIILGFTLPARKTIESPFRPGARGAEAVSFRHRLSGAGLGPERPAIPC